MNSNAGGYIDALIAAYKKLAAINSGITAQGIMRCVSYVLSSEFPVLFPGGEKAGVAGHIMNEFDARSASELELVWEFSDAVVKIFVEIENRDASSFAAGSRRLQLLISALTPADKDR